MCVAAMVLTVSGTPRASSAVNVQPACVFGDHRDALLVGTYLGIELLAIAHVCVQLQILTHISRHS